MPELGIRKLSLAANYLYAQEKLSMNKDDASAYARKALRFQNFTYNLAALPDILRSPLGRLIGQYKSYLIFELQFIRTLSPAQLCRYAGMQMTLGGFKGFAVLLKSVPFIALLMSWSGTDPEEWLDRLSIASRNAGMPDLTRGVVGVLGGDISQPATFQFPTDPLQLAGPFLSDVFRLSKAILDAGKYKDFAGEAIGDALTGLSPAMYYWRNLVESVLSEDGAIRDRRGRPVYWPNTGELILMGMGIAPTDYKMQRDMVRRWQTRRRESDIERGKAADRFVNYVLGHPGVLDNISSMPEWLKDTYATYQLSGEMIKGRAVYQNLSPAERMILETRLLQKPELLDYLRGFVLDTEKPRGPRRK
jgi:hypothetical protein